MIGHLLGVYRKGRKFTDGYAKFDALRQQFQANSAIRISSLTSIVELGLTAGDYLKANQAAAQLLVDPDADKLPALTYVALGKVLLETQQFDRAREAFEKMRKAFEDDPMMNAQAALGMARAQLGQKQYDEAEKAFKDLTQVEAKLGVRADAELGLARVYKAKGKMVEAIDLLNKVLPSRGDASFEAAFELGHVFLTLPEKDAKKKKDNTKAALAYFARLFFAPAGPMADEAAYQVPRCHELLGNPAAARAAYQNYVKRYPDGKFSKQAEERIKALTAPAK
jgi:tetratricopeptide (TPR) repeat protein